MARSETPSAVGRNPPVDYAVAVWLGTPKDELAKGLREGWIRPPFGVDARAWAEQQGLGIEEAVSVSTSGATHEPPSPDAPVPSPSVSVPALRDRVEALLRRLDATMQTSTFDAAWREAGSDDATRAASLVSFLGRALQVGSDESVAVEDRIDALDVLASNYAGDARFVRIAGTATRELERVASTDSALRRALAEHSPWALTGDAQMARAADVTGRYDRFDANTGEALLSDAWVGDRAKHAAWRSAAAAGHSLDVTGDGWRFIDRAQGDDATIEVIGAAQGSPTHQVIFAQDDGDSVTGGAGTDRVHGGQGDDALRGRAGDDLLEGDAGDDFLQGGVGRDVLLGQQGSDELDGGSGDDELAGGSGADELTGGRGNDALRGGAGDDRYILQRGDGEDVIDDDGGVIVFEDVVVSGTMRRSGEGWVSQDGALRFTLEGDADAASLVISAIATDDGSQPAGRVRIQSWTPGTFGISLASESDAQPHDEADAVDEASNAAQPSAPEVGNEAPLFANASEPPCPEQVDGAVTIRSDPSTASLGLHGQTGWPLLDASASLALVDTLEVSSALDAWSTGASASNGLMQDDVVGVTSFDVSEALAAVELDAESEDGAMAIPLETRLLSLTPHRPYDTTVVPPQPMLRST